MPKNSIQIGFKLPLMEQFGHLLAQMPAESGARVAAVAMQQAVRPIVTAVKASVPKRTGALRASITSVVRIYAKNGVVVGVVGPDKKARYFGGVRLRRGGNMFKSDMPAKYAHLVEYGHFRVAGRGASGKSLKGRTIREGTVKAKGWVRAQPFMRPGVAASETAAVAALAAGFAKGLERENKRIVRKTQQLRARAA